MLDFWSWSPLWKTFQELCEPRASSSVSLPGNLTRSIVKCTVIVHTHSYGPVRNTLTSFLDLAKGATSLEFLKTINTFLQKRTLHGNDSTILAQLRNSRKGRKQCSHKQTMFWKSGESHLVLNFILALYVLFIGIWTLQIYRWCQIVRKSENPSQETKKIQRWEH